MQDTPQLGLPLIEAAQAQKHVTHNEALALLDALAQIAVETMNAITPPPDAQDGSRFHVGAAGEGVFAGRAGQIALRDAGAWRFLIPRAGWLAWSVAQGGLFVFDGAQWIGVETILRNLQNLERLGVGTAADEANPIAAKVNAALFAARGAQEGGSGDLRFTLNKESEARTVSQLYQSNWSGRAETGLMGDDRYRIKVSPDGAAWIDAIEINPADGQTRHVDGAAGAPGVAFSAAPNAGMWRDGNGDLAFSRAGVEVLRLAPSAVQARAGSSAFPSYSFIADPDTGFTNPSVNAVGVVTNGVERVRVTSSGNVGVGANAPSSPLVINTGNGNFDSLLGADGTIAFGNAESPGTLRPSIVGRSASSSGISIFSRTVDENTVGDMRFDARPASGLFTTMTNNAFRFTNNGVIALAINRNGNAGFGTDTPSTRLHVNGPIRCGSFTRTTVPAASTVGSGTMIWVTNPQSGAARAFWSNGADWRDQANVEP